METNEKYDLFFNVYEKAVAGDEQAKDVLLEAMRRFMLDFFYSEAEKPNAN